MADLVGYKEISAYLHRVHRIDRSEWTLCRDALRDDNRLPVVTVHRRVRISSDEVDAWVARERQIAALQLKATQSST